MLNGLDLEPYGVQQRATAWRAPISTRRHPVAIPGLHGDLLASRLPVFGPPIVTWHLWHDSDSPAAISQATDIIVSALAQPDLTLTRSLLTAGGRVEHSARAELVSVDWGDYMLRSHARATIVFSVPGVVFRDGNTTPWTALVGSGLTATIPHLSDSTGPIPDAIIRFTGPITNPSITDTNSGTSLSWTGTVAAGEYLFLDASRLTARKAGADAWLSGGSLVGSVDYGGDGPLQLWPAIVTVGGSYTVTPLSPGMLLSPSTLLIPDGAPSGQGDSLGRQVQVQVSGSGMTAATQVAVRAEGSYL